MAATAEEPCGLCGAAAAPYTCPRCNRRLCSLPCYRGHGGCAEALYRQQVLQALEAERGDPPPGRARLDAALRRLRRLGEAEDEAAPLGHGLWERLSPQERAAFQRLVDTGDVAALVLPWRPWWWRGAARRGWWRRWGSLWEEEEKRRRRKSEGPAPPAAVPPLRSLAAGPTSPLLHFQLPNALCGYAFALALHNGDDRCCPRCPPPPSDVSGALGARQVFRSTAEALQAALGAVAACGYPQCPLGDAGAVLAVAQLLRGERPGATATALSHLARLLGRAGSWCRREERGRFYGAKKKCEFLLAWSCENRQALSSLAAEAQAEYERHRRALSEVSAVSRQLERMWGGKRPPEKKPLVEELD
ncbi:LOW QUALITY PROTEIN: zinc finger HIT domain-containing protein 2 [Apteryx mantelli]|uniref:LOW QUALITY PROTEIN: zinc finger HIT domain-containing protein 2 n=1 Tax=Apteryx mantelli TaxID=2696672 RepID=A0ABM4G121_9AVES